MRERLFLSFNKQLSYCNLFHQYFCNLSILELLHIISTDNLSLRLGDLIGYLRNNT